DVLVDRDIDTGDTRHGYLTSTRGEPGSLSENGSFFNISKPLRSALALLVARVGRADDPHDALAPHDLAVLADLPDRWTNLHLITPLAGQPAAAGAAQVGLLHEPLVLVRHHVGVELGHEVHDDDDHDEERSAAEIERHAGIGHQ